MDASRVLCIPWYLGKCEGGAPNYAPGAFAPKYRGQMPEGRAAMQHNSARRIIMNYATFGLPPATPAGPRPGSACSPGRAPPGLVLGRGGGGGGGDQQSSGCRSSNLKMVISKFRGHVASRPPHRVTSSRHVPASHHVLASRPCIASRPFVISRPLHRNDRIGCRSPNLRQPAHPVSLHSPPP